MSKNFGGWLIFFSSICHDEFVQDRTGTGKGKLAEQRVKKLTKVLKMKGDDGKWAQKEELNFGRREEEGNEFS